MMERYSVRWGAIVPNVGRIGEEAVFNASKFSQCTTAD